MSREAPVITLDGPGGAGKGTLASKLAERLGWSLLDSGALYRLVALCALREDLDPDSDRDCRRAVELARRLVVGFDADAGVGQRVKLAGEDVTDAIRTTEVSEAASRWAIQLPVRDALLDRQRRFVVPPGLIADGRDMGTVIFPDADLKIFVTATAAERAERRHAQLSGGGVAANLEGIYREIVKRDERDASRDASPLKPAVDAYVIDTTGETVAASSAKMFELVAAKGWLRNT